jgi:hypothetical protein
VKQDKLSNKLDITGLAPASDLDFTPQVVYLFSEKSGAASTSLDFTVDILVTQGSTLLNTLIITSQDFDTKKMILRSKHDLQGTPTGKSICIELCFTQSKMAERILVGRLPGCTL